MKQKLFWGLAAVALIFSSCSNNEEILNNEKGNPGSIGFEVSTGKTRAVTSNLATLQASSTGFGVYATNGASALEFIKNEGYLYQGNLWKWAVTDQDWPLTSAGYPINFYAYFPKNGLSLNSTLKSTYTIDADPANQVDYLAARQAGIASRPASGKVSFDFKHILSKIDFKVVTGAAVSVEVQSIAVKNVGNSGEFDFSSMTWSQAPGTFLQSHSYMRAPASQANMFVGKTTATDVTGSSGSLMLMPQNLTGRAWTPTAAPTSSDSYIEVVYRVKETAAPGKDLVGFSDATKHPDYAASSMNPKPAGPLFVKVGFTLPTNWQMGKAFTYTIYLGTPNTSGGNLVTDKFIDVDGNETDLPVKYPDTGTPINVPSPIVDNKPIGFIVSVTDWGTPSNVDVQ